MKEPYKLDEEVFAQLSGRMGVGATHGEKSASVKLARPFILWQRGPVTYEKVFPLS